MKRVSSWLAAILLGVLVWLVWLYFQRGARAALAASKEEAAQRDEYRERASLRRQLADAETAATAAGPTGSAVHPVFHMDDLIRDHPELAVVYGRERRRAVMRRYGPALAGLALPPETLDRVKDLLLERMDAREAASRNALAMGFMRLSPEWNAAEAQAGQEAEMQVTAALRAAGSISFGQLDARVGYYDTVQHTYGPDLANAGAAMTAGQAQALVRALTNAAAGSDPSAPLGGDDQADPATRLSPHDVRFLALAGQILTGAQLAAIRGDRVEANEKSAIEKSYAPGGGAVYIAP